ncbi:MAG: response regulator [Planctomycetia bacterium]|nr:response regulator [Planctomycetia bacterium]
MNEPTRLRVLYVDDNPDVADTAVELLLLVGFDARACYDGPSALSVAQEFDPHVCLIDLRMPRMDGIELLARLREQAAGHPVLFAVVTAMGDKEARRQTAEAGFSLHLVKPVDPHDLLDILDQLAHNLPAPPQGNSRQQTTDFPTEEPPGAK